MRSKLIICLLMTAFSLAINSCKQQEILVPEQAKDIAGEWHIIKALRNGVDITTMTDFTRFRIRFSSDLKYTIDNPLPFVVSQNGNYALDDPKYPFRLTFTPASGSAVSTTFNYPVVNGKRRIDFSFSPGCTANTYRYTLEKVNP